MISKPCVAAFLAAFLAGCSGIRFSSTDDGRSHPYRVATPALKVVIAPDCTMTAEVISIPGKMNYLSFQNGIGKINDTVEFEPGGTIKKIVAVQEGVADDIVKLLNAGKGLSAMEIARSQAEKCTASVAVYLINVDQSTQVISVNLANPLLKVDASLAK